LGGVGVVFASLALEQKSCSEQHEYAKSYDLCSLHSKTAIKTTAFTKSLLTLV
jgi:hypothetical protein